MRMHQTAHRVHFNHHEQLLEERDEEIMILWAMAEERGSGEAGCGRCPQRKETQNLFWERSRQYKILVERHPKSSRTKTHKQREYWFILNHLTRDAFEEMWHSCEFDIKTTDEMYQVLGAAFGGGHKTKAHLERQFYNHKQQQGKVYANTRMHLWC